MCRLLAFGKQQRAEPCVPSGMASVVGVTTLPMKETTIDSSLFPAELSIRPGAKGQKAGKASTKRQVDHLKALEQDDDASPADADRADGDDDDDDEGGEAVEEEMEEEDLDEEDNDYIESYFDNGEGDHDDGGDDAHGNFLVLAAPRLSISMARSLTWLCHPDDTF